MCYLHVSAALVTLVVFDPPDRMREKLSSHQQLQDARCVTSWNISSKQKTNKGPWMLLTLWTLHQQCLFQKKVSWQAYTNYFCVTMSSLNPWWFVFHKVHKKHTTYVTSIRPSCPMFPELLLAETNGTPMECCIDVRTTNPRRERCNKITSREPQTAGWIKTGTKPGGWREEHWKMLLPTFIKIQMSTIVNPCCLTIL